MHVIHFSTYVLTIVVEELLISSIMLNIHCNSNNYYHKQSNSTIDFYTIIHYIVMLIEVTSNCYN